MSPLPRLETLAVAALLQTAPQQADRLMALAEAASHEELVSETRLHPEEARQAFRDLLRHSPEYPDPAAGRLAVAYAEAWTDPFLADRYRRFLSWSVDERLSQLAANSLRRAGNEAYVRDGVDEALRLWRLSLEEVERLGDTVGVARSLGNIGAGHHGAGRLDSSTVYYERSYELALSSGDFVTAANALNVLASLSRDAGDLPQARSLYLRALDMHERVGALRAAGYDHHNLGLLVLALGDLGGARRELETAIAISGQTGHLDDEADHLSSLADVMMASGEYAEAEAALTRALDLDHETGNRLGEAGVRHSLGLLALARGDYAAAVRELGEARDSYLEMNRAGDGVSVQSDLARARAATGDLRRGMDDLREARRRAESERLSVSIRADLALATGDFDLALNEYGQARLDYAEAERLYRRLSDYAGIAAAQHGQAFVHLYQTDFDEAEAALTEALGSQQALGDPRATALTRLLLAEVYLEADDLEKARAVASDARDVLAALPDRVGEAAALSMLGGIDTRDGLYGKADERYVEGLALLAGGDSPDIGWRLHAGRARTLEARGRQTEALLELELAAADIEHGAGGWTYTRSGSGYLADKWEVYARLAFLQAELDDVEGAFETSEHLRAQRLLALLDRGRVHTREPDSALVSREQDLRRRIAELATRLEPVGAMEGVLRGSAGPGMTPEQASEALEKARREYVVVLEEMREAEVDHGDLVRPGIANWTSVAANLSPEELFVEYLISDSVALAFVVSTNGIASVRLPESREMLSDLIGYTRGVLQDASRGGRSELWRVPLERLHRILIEPIEAAGWLEGRQQLILLPHGELNYLPFQALISPDGRFLVERFTVSTAPSATVWTQLAARPSRVTGGGILAMAPRVSDLPGTRQEVARIRDAFGDQATLLLGAKATEEALAATAGTYDVIHLATYGVVNRTNPLFSYVELGAGGEHDGRLEVHELFGLDLDADLVVLSACETGLASGSRADVPPGDDWVGLVRGFLSAGASEVIATLWRVEDEATADLMGAFYRGLAAGMSTRDSLAAAQRELLSYPETANPFYWAGFVLVGEGRGAR